MEIYALKNAVEEYQRQKCDCAPSVESEEIGHGLMILLIEKLTELNNNLEKLVIEGRNYGL